MAVLLVDSLHGVSWLRVANSDTTGATAGNIIATIIRDPQWQEEQQRHWPGLHRRHPFIHTRYHLGLLKEDNPGDRGQEQEC